jgi:hypothetical protein
MSCRFELVSAEDVRYLISELFSDLDGEVVLLGPDSREYRAEHTGAGRWLFHPVDSLFPEDQPAQAFRVELTVMDSVHVEPYHFPLS